MARSRHRRISPALDQILEDIRIGKESEGVSCTTTKASEILAKEIKKRRVV